MLLESMESSGGGAFFHRVPNVPPDQHAVRSRCFHPAGDFVEFRKSQVEQTIGNRFEEILARNSDRVAVKTRTDTLTYSQLDRAANRVANALSSIPGVSDGPIGLLFENGAPFVVASLGILKAGKIQMSLESTFPKARLDYLLDQSGATAIVTDNRNLALARQLRSLPLVNIDEIDNESSLLIPPRKVNPHETVVIDYTSGSTGRPKGIMWDHRTLLHVIMRHTNVSHICRHDGLVMFRASVRTYLSMLLNGATYYPVDLAREAPADLAGWMMQEPITIYRSAVSAFRNFTTALTGGERFPNLRVILLYGEPVYHTDVDIYRQRFPDDCILGSSLGCNELDDFSYFFIDKSTPLRDGFLPAGYTVEDMDVLLLDDNRLPVNRNEIGEICVRSPYSPVSYWRQPELTQAAFIPDPDGSEARVYRTGDAGRLADDGCLIHMGRKDDQVKIRGYRVNIGEVEAALLAAEGVEQAVVVGWDSRENEKKLVAYIIPSGSRPPGIRELRRGLIEKLPSYMVPSAFIFVDAMPLTATGKVDRRRLPPPDGTRPETEHPFVEPRTVTEQGLARIWAEVLGIANVGALDNFVELGGDSLQAARVIGRVMTEFHVRLPLQTVVDSPTLAEMALAIVQSQSQATMDPDLDDLLAKLEGMSETEALSRLEEKGS